MKLKQSSPSQPSYTDIYSIAAKPLHKFYSVLDNYTMIIHDTLRATLYTRHSQSYTLYKTLSELHFDCEWHLGLVRSSSFEQSFMQNTQINVGAFVGIVFAKSAIKESNILFFTPGDFFSIFNKYSYRTFVQGTTHILKKKKAFDSLSKLSHLQFMKIFTFRNISGLKFEQYPNTLNMSMYKLPEYGTNYYRT